MKILLIEDEKRMAQALCEILRQEGYEVDHCAKGDEGFETAENGSYDIILLDVMLPGMNGFEIASRLRRDGISSSILMLTAKSELDDKVLGLDSGADDYLTKPFVTKELLARLRALGRRRPAPDNGIFSYGDISVNRNTFTLSCTKNNESVRLGEKEYHILEYLIANHGQILTREQLAVKVWGYDNEAEYNNVEVYMSFTRKKLAYVGAKTEIKAIRGIGYELRYRDV